MDVNRSRPVRAHEVGALLVAAVVMLPTAIVAGSLFMASSGEVWSHLRQTVLADYVLNSAVLVCGVVALSCFLGIPAAWFTSMCDFRLRRVFVWLLPLPLAMPAYIVAYTYTGLLDYSGPVQSMLREGFGWGRNDYWFFEIRSLGGAAAMIGFVLYPYVYLLCRTSFLERSLKTVEISRTLGNSVLRSFLVLSLPLARPAIAAGAALVAMETLADYGTVFHFGVNTFTTGIFKVFYGLDDSVAALQLSAMLLGAIALLLTCERLARHRARYDATMGNFPPSRLPLSRRSTVLAWLFCGLPVLLGFLLPVSVLLKWAVLDFGWNLVGFAADAWNSLLLAGLAATISVSLAMVLGYANRATHRRSVQVAVSLSSLGYAIPGTIIAVGLLGPLVWVDHRLIGLAREALSVDIGLVFSGSIAALLYAYTVRFMAVSFGAVTAGMEKIKPTLDYSARSLGKKPHQVLMTVHLPLLKGTLLTALLIVFLDVLKELPATLILRPFNFNTLAVRAYELASDERLTDAATPSIMIVMAGIIPVVILNRITGRAAT